MKPYIITLIAGALVISQAHAANLIVNGSFEDPDVTTGTYSIFSGGVGIPGWYSTLGDGPEIQDNVAGSPYDGNQHLELDSNNNSNILQDIPVVPGELYSLTFAYSARPGVADTSSEIEVFADGVSLGFAAEDGTGLSDTAWFLTGGDLVALDSILTLEFRAFGTDDSLGGYIDDVRFEGPAAVPDAGGSLVLLGLGVSALTLGRRFAFSSRS